jgi:hypothetical protein
MLKPYYCDAKTECTTLPPLPVVMLDGDKEFEVEIVAPSSPLGQMIANKGNETI